VYLAKFLSNAGVCSRRNAALFVKSGDVSVDGVVVMDPAYQVESGDSVVCSGRPVEVPRHKTYILLNKPVGFITTMNDDLERQTVLDLITGASENRIYPVGRLDIMTNGLILMTDDGDLAQKLAHPKGNVRKLYEATLDLRLTYQDLGELKRGIMLDDGLAVADRVYHPRKGKNHVVRMELHAGRTRIVRRMFKSLGYNVMKLDRIKYAGLGQEGLRTGSWRRLTQHEVATLKSS
jgi:23S rRNA pseudouridine2605 synthase